MCLWVCCWLFLVLVVFLMVLDVLVWYWCEILLLIGLETVTVDSRCILSTTRRRRWMFFLVFCVWCMFLNFCFFWWILWVKSKSFWVILYFVWVKCNYCRWLVLNSTVLIRDTRFVRICDMLFYFYFLWFLVLLCCNFDKIFVFCFI